MVYDILWIFLLTFYVIFVILFTKRIYHLMIDKGIKKIDAIYYNRKFVHIFAGGIITLLVPFVFDSSVYPLLCGLAISVITFYFHKTKKTLYWFQRDDNINDVTFCFMWGIIIFVLWEIMGSPWIAIIPPAFMAFGDGVTGIVRNALFKKRSKHPIGNIFMAMVCIPLGFFLASIEGIAIGGVIAGIVASFMERVEIGPIDDNILITVSSAIILYIYTLF